MIEIKSISKQFKDISALSDVSCTIEDGKFISFLGPSGSGKSTLLNIISGIIAPSNGNVFFDKMDVTFLSPKERNIGFVFQNYALYPNMTVRKNIEFPLESMKINKKKRTEEVEWIAEIVRVSHLLAKKPNELSGGEQQRVAIARALVKKPRLLLLDEPFSNLDPRLSSEMRIDIKELQSQLGITTIMVTHNQAEAMELSDNIALLHNGSLIQYGTPFDIYNNPQCYFSAQFLGDVKINSVMVDLDKIFSKRGYINEVSKEGEQGNLAIMCFRPESVVLGESDYSFKVKVLSILNHGREYLINAATDKNEIRFFLPTNTALTILVEQTISIGIDKKNVFFFEPKTGVRKNEK